MVSGDGGGAHTSYQDQGTVSGVSHLAAENVREAKRQFEEPSLKVFNRSRTG